MASPGLPASMLLASVVLLLCGTVSVADLRSHDLFPPAAQSHDLFPPAVRSHDPFPPAVRSLPARFKRDSPVDTRERVAAAITSVDEIISLTTEISSHSKKLAEVFESLGKFGQMLPGFLGVAFSFVTLALAIIPQEDPLQKGFNELNRKLDALSFQVSNLAVDVEWFNYASVYAQDEVRILNAWKKFNEFREKLSQQSEEGRLQQAKIFTTYYKLTGTEGSMDNLYHYLTVSDTSLSGNLNDLLSRKYKCSIGKIVQYNKYFSSLLLRGMVLNQFYWKLIGLHNEGKEAEHKQMLADVYGAQKAALRSCLDKTEQQMKADVGEIVTGISVDKKQDIADRVKEHMDKKYFWYSWVVVVHDSDQDANHVYHPDMVTVHVGSLSIVVGFTQTAKVDRKEAAGERVSSCFQQNQDMLAKYGSTAEWKTCDFIKSTFNNCGYFNDGSLNDYVKILHSSYNDYYVQAPEDLQSYGCTINGAWYKAHAFFSKSGLGCEDEICLNGGVCVPLLKSKEFICECVDGYFGTKCEKPTDPLPVPEIDQGLVHAAPC